MNPDGSGDQQVTDFDDGMIDSGKKAFHGIAVMIIRLFAEENLLEIAKRCRCSVRLEVLAKTAKVFTDHLSVVVNDEHAIG